MLGGKVCRMEARGEKATSWKQLGVCVTSCLYLLILDAVLVVKKEVASSHILAKTRSVVRVVIELGSLQKQGKCVLLAS